MKSSLTLLLNLAVLLVNFFVSLGVTDTQVQTLRTTARIAYGTPRRRSPKHLVTPGPPATPPATSAPRARLVRFLARCEGPEKLDTAQMGALLDACDRYAGEVERLGNRLRELGGNGFRARGLCGELQRKLRDEVASTLRAAAVADPALRERLVRLVLASAG